MMSLGNNNLIYMMVPNDTSMSNSQPNADSHAQGQFPTYTVVTSPHSRVSQMMTNVAKTSLMSDIDDPVKPAINKTSIISIVKGSSGASNQQIFVRKNSATHDMLNECKNVSNDAQLVLSRTPSGECSNPNIYIRKNSMSQDLISDSQRRNHPDSHVVHHGRNSALENKVMNNQLPPPPPYQDGTLFPRTDASYSSFQIKSPSFESHESMRSALQHVDGKSQATRESPALFHQHGEQKNQQIHESPRPSHQQADQNSHQRSESVRTFHQQTDPKMQSIIGSPRASDQQREPKNPSITDTGRCLQQGDQLQNQQMHEASRALYELNEQKMHQKHEPTRLLQKGQQIRESRPLYHLGEQKTLQMHDVTRSLYQHGDQNNKQSHEPMYPLSESKNQHLHESTRTLHHQGDEKEQQAHDAVRSIYQNNEVKAHQSHENRSHQTPNQKKQLPENVHQMHQMNDQKQQAMHDNNRPLRQHSDPKGQQIHVHKVHHGNARVKYVEFKPIQESAKYRQMLHHPSHSHYSPNMKQNLHYSSISPSAQHLTVQTPSHSPLSPLHSPPALRPPPTIPSGTAWHSPPSLVPSPEVRPRFDFISSPQPVTTAGSPCPVPVANMVQHKHYSGKAGKQQLNIPGNHNILLPRLPASYQMATSTQNSLSSMLPRSKGTFIQTVCSHSPANSPLFAANQHTFSQPGFPASSVTTTVTVTMTYIPIATSTKDKFVYVPVNSGQPVVLYQNQQASGKPVILPQQVLQASKNVRNAKDIAKESSAYTTVRLQGLVNCGIPKAPHFSSPSNSQNSPMKGVTYHFANPTLSQGMNQPFSKSPGFIKLDKKSPFNLDMIDLEKEKSNLTSTSSKETARRDENAVSSGVSTISKAEGHREVMTLINNQLHIVSTQGGGSQPTHIGLKRSSVVATTAGDTDLLMHSLDGPCVSTHEKRVNEDIVVTSGETVLNAETCNDAKEKKRRGRPPFEKISKKVRKEKKGKGSKLLSVQENVVTALAGDPNSSTNQLMIETYKKQQQLLLQKHYFEDPLLRVAELSPTPDKWSCDDVYKYLQSTDCAFYADALKAEEIDGKSFILLTREALTEFMGIKLGPALKLAGHAASLRARQRVYCLSQQQHQIAHLPTKEKKSLHISKENQSSHHPPKEKKLRLSSSSKHPSKINELTKYDPIKSEELRKSSPCENSVNKDLITQEKLPSVSTSNNEIMDDVFEPGPSVIEELTSDKTNLHDSNISLTLRNINKVGGVADVNGQTGEILQAGGDSVKIFPNDGRRSGDSISKSMETIPVDIAEINSNTSKFLQKALSPLGAHILTDLESDVVSRESAS